MLSYYSPPLFHKHQPIIFHVLLRLLSHWEPSILLLHADLAHFTELATSLRDHVASERIFTQYFFHGHLKPEQLAILRYSYLRRLCDISKHLACCPSKKELAMLHLERITKAEMDIIWPSFIFKHVLK